MPFEVETILDKDGKEVLDQTKIEVPAHIQPVKPLKERLKGFYRSSRMEAVNVKE